MTLCWAYLLYPSTGYVPPVCPKKASGLPVYAADRIVLITVQCDVHVNGGDCRPSSMGSSFLAVRTSVTEQRPAALLTSPSMVPFCAHLLAVLVAIALRKRACLAAAAAAAGQCFPGACRGAGLLSVPHNCRKASVERRLLCRREWAHYHGTQQSSQLVRRLHWLQEADQQRAAAGHALQQPHQMQAHPRGDCLYTYDLSCHASLISVQHNGSVQRHMLLS